MAANSAVTPARPLLRPSTFLETPQFKLNPTFFEGSENSVNVPGDDSPLFCIKSPLAGINAVDMVISAGIPDPSSPTKRQGHKNNLFGGESASAYELPTSESQNEEIYVPLIADLSLLPIHCDLNTTTTPRKLAVEFTAATPESCMSHDTTMEEESESCIPEPSSPTSKRLGVLAEDLAATPLRRDLLQPAAYDHTGTTAKTPTQIDPLPKLNFNASIEPLFEKAPFPLSLPLSFNVSSTATSTNTYSSHTPSRIVRPPPRKTSCSAAPGIRMPGSMKLEYPQAHRKREVSLHAHLDPRPLEQPRISSHLPSPYPRLSKSAIHPVSFYEHKLSQSEDGIVPTTPGKNKYATVTPRHIAATTPKPKPDFSATPGRVPASHQLETPKNKPLHVQPTCMTTGLGKSKTRNLTVPVSPKLSTSQRSRKCQCCEGGVHGVKPLPRASVSKKDTPMRRRPSPGPVTPRSRVAVEFHATPAKTPSRLTGSRPESSYSSCKHSEYAHGSNMKTAPTPATASKKQPDLSQASSTAHATPKPKLNLTTSLPEFKQPLADIAPTPEPSRAEVEAKLRTPLPFKLPMPALPPKPVPTPIKFMPRNEAFGPGLKEAQQYTAAHPFGLEAAVQAPT